jgi:putative peptidoglycan lipid II flippase
MDHDEALNIEIPQARPGALQNVRRRAGALFQSDINRRIFQAAFVVGGVTFIVKITALLRDQVIASRFGTGDLVDAYVTAFFLPAFFVTVLGDAISAPLTKGYIDIRQHRGKEAAQELFSQVLTIGILLFLAAWALLWIFADPALRTVASNFDQEKFDLTKRLFIIMLPTVLIGSLASILTTMLSSRERFSLSSWASLAPPAVSTVALFLTGSAEQRITWLSWSIVGGTVMQLAVLAWGLEREGISVRMRRPQRSPEVRLATRRSGATFLNNSIFSGQSFVDQAIAASLGAGSVAMLSYGNKLVMPLMLVSTTAISTAVFPYFAKMSAERDFDGIRHTLRFYTRLVSAATIPLALIIIVASNLIISVIFERGAFDAGDTADVSRVQQMFALMIPVYSVGMLYSRVLIAMQANRQLLFGSILIFVLNAVGGIILAKWIGVAGIALSTVLNYACSLFYKMYMVERVIQEHEAAP